MQRSACAAACLAQTYYGCPVQAVPVRFQRRPSGGREQRQNINFVPSLQSLASPTVLSELASSKGASDPLRSLAMFLMTLHPEAAFSPPCPSVHLSKRKLAFQERSIHNAVGPCPVSCDPHTGQSSEESRPLKELVRERRDVRSAGLKVGCALVLGSVAAGIALGLFDVLKCGVLFAFLGTLAGGFLLLQYLQNSERGVPLDETLCFEVRESTQPGKGSGLFARTAIAADRYLFDYEGERLSEDDFFARYPEGDGRYIACITDDLYIDGAYPERSNVARWMNHASGQRANVFWRKQRLGPELERAMHFYALCEIKPGDELLFDYGSEYWEALGEEPLP